MKYTAEEVRHCAKHIDPSNPEGFEGMYAKAFSMLNAYAECIKASEGVVPVAYQSKRRPEDYPDEWHKCSKETFDTIKRMKDSPWIVRELFDRPPAQAAQVDPAAKPRTLADFVHAPDAERAQIGQQVAARMDEMMAEPVAQGELVDCPECGSRCTYRAISMSDDVIYEYTPAQAAQSVDVEKVGEVIAYLKKGHRFDAEMADKLTAALQEGEG